MEIHYKCTIWNSIILDDNLKKEDIIKELEKELSPFDIELGNSEYYPIHDTEEYIIPDENMGEPTVELMEETSYGLKAIWDNVNGKIE